jgi:hypothetical protein
MSMDDSDFESELWVSEEEPDYEEEQGIVQYAARAESAAFFMLELTPDAEAGGKYPAALPRHAPFELL